VQFGDFWLLKKLGTGSLGAVYQAQQISLGREVAVKVLAKPLATKPTFVQRFYREAQVLCNLEHPNFLPCHEAGEEQGFPYLVMDCIEGGNLETWVKKLGKFSLGDALYIALKCAGALHHAHELNLVHGNLKPENVLLSRGGAVKLADLGLTREADLSLPQTALPVYLAPEQLGEVKQVDGRSDIYALGGILYFLVTGQPPFRAATRSEVIQAKEKGTFEPARRSVPDVPEALDLILGKMLANEPEQRYQTCAEVMLALEKLSLAHKSLDPLHLAGPITKPPPRPRTPRPLPKHLLKHAHDAAEEEEEESDVWYASFHTPEGKKIIKKLMTDQVLELIRRENFTPDTQLSRSKHGTYRPLTAYPQFETALRAQLAKGAPGSKSEQFRSLYGKIKKAPKADKGRSWFEKLVARLGGDPRPLIWLAVVIVLGLGLLLGLRIFK
jgi:serine/threonine-protein kinase